MQKGQVGKHTIKISKQYILKSKIESRAHYVPEPAQGRVRIKVAKLSSEHKIAK